MLNCEVFIGCTPTTCDVHCQFCPTDDLDDATIEKIGNPEKVITAFGPEVIGENVEGKVLSTATAERSGRIYYQFELEPPHVFITATAAGNRLYLFSVTANGKTMVLNNRINVRHLIATFLLILTNSWESIFCRPAMEEALQGSETNSRIISSRVGFQFLLHFYSAWFLLI